MVHASLRKTGPVEGGATAVLAALLETLGSGGTLVMVLGADDEEPFDVRSTPAEEEIGILAEVFRQSPGVVVNDHAAARYAAFGADANALLEDVPLHDYHGPGSVLERLTQRDGWVLRLGADPDTTTLTHLAEYYARIPNKRRVRRKYLRADTGEQWIESLDDNDGIIAGDDGGYFARILLDYVAGGNARVGQVGHCQVAELLCAADFVAFATRELERQFAAAAP